jgi:hypothetical protein
MPDILDDEMDISSSTDDDYVGAGFEGTAYDVFEDDDDDQPPASNKDAAAPPPPPPPAEPAGDQDADLPPADEVAAEPPEDETYDELKALRQRNDELAANLQMMQAQVQQMMQAPPPQREQTPDGLAKSLGDAHEYGINMDEIDKPTEDEWGEDPNRAMAKVMTQINAKIADKVKSGVATEVSQTVMSNLQRAQQAQQAQRQGIANALELVPEAANNDEVRQTFQAIMDNPQNRALRDSPNGTFMAVLAAANLHGLSPITARQTAQQEGRQQGAQAERSRQARLKSGVMQQGGRGGKSSVALSPRERAVAKQMGLTPKAYADALDAHRGGN